VQLNLDSTCLTSILEQAEKPEYTDAMDRKVRLGESEAKRFGPGKRTIGVIIRQRTALASHSPESPLEPLYNHCTTQFQGDCSQFDPLMTLAAVAGITQRIRLMTTVLITPLHNAGVLAKQAASLDVLSNGRLTLGLGVGGREDDFRAAPASFHDRGKRFERQLELMTRIWSGQPVDDETGPIGPAPAQPGGPELLLGASTPKAFRYLHFPYISLFQHIKVDIMHENYFVEL
jgi:Luciferase-like monooxygenase